MSTEASRRYRDMGIFMSKGCWGGCVTLVWYGGPRRRWILVASRLPVSARRSYINDTTDTRASPPCLTFLEARIPASGSWVPGSLIFEVGGSHSVQTPALPLP